MTLEEAYIEFMGELEEYYEKEKAQAEDRTECLQRKLPTKQKDPGTFTIPFCFGKVQGKALCDLGSSISLMSLHFAKKWEIGEIDKTHTREIVLADHSVLRPSGIIRDAIVKIKDLIFPVDFIIIDVEEDADVPVIL
ncbi:hypothetical protein A2U01_0042477, partial [Trifolium medium]|nr:hypothetical protein [Trifolium medium]